jgi:sulfatase maturation enzyme AslB (radical SAM superfamily)
MNCAYCYEENKEDIYMSLQDVEHILKKIYASDANPDEVEIFGGEPLLNWKAFSSILNFCNERNTPMVTSTNGVLLTPDKILLLKKYNILVGISYDGRTTHDAYRRTKENGKTERIVRDSITNALVNDLDIIINMTFQKANAKYLADDIKELSESGVNKIQIYNVNHNQYSVCDEERIRIFKQILQFAEKNKINIYLNMSLSKSKTEHYYYYGTATKVQHKGTLGTWATVGWD